MIMSVVAHRAGAKLFKNIPGKPGWEAIRKFDNPDGRLKDTDIYQDSPGRTGGMPRHSLTSKSDAHELAGVKFAAELADAIETARQGKVFNRLVLVAEPRFLGELRAALTPESAKLVVGSLNRDFAHTSDDAVSTQLDAAFGDLEPLQGD